MAFLPPHLRGPASRKVVSALRKVLRVGTVGLLGRPKRKLLVRAYDTTRADLAEELRGYLEKMSQSTIMRDFNAEAITRLNKKASLFRSDQDFRRIWMMFAKHFGHEAAVAYYDLDREVEADVAIQVSRNLNHCFQVRQAIVTALIENLTGVPGYDSKLEARLATVKAAYEDLGMVDLFEDAEPAVPPETPSV